MDAYYTLGVTLWQQGEFPAAVEQLRKAVELKPDYAEAYYTMGTVLKQMNQLPEAAQALREAIRLQPEFAGAHTTLAAVLRQMGDTAGAESERQLGDTLVKQKIGLQGATFATNSGQTHAECRRSRWCNFAISQRDKARHPYAPAHYELAVALSRKGDKAEARKNSRRLRNWIRSSSPPPKQITVQIPPTAPFIQPNRFCNGGN